MSHELPIKVSIPRAADGTPECSEEEWDDTLRWYASDLLGLPEVCEVAACAAANECAGEPVACIRRFSPAVDPVIDAAGLLVKARARFIDGMRAARGRKKAAGRRRVRR